MSDLPKDIGKPRASWRIGDVIGIVMGGALLIITLAFALYAAVS